MTKRIRLSSLYYFGQRDRVSMGVAGGTSDEFLQVHAPDEQEGLDYWEDIIWVGLLGDGLLYCHSLALL